MNKPLEKLFVKPENRGMRMSHEEPIEADIHKSDIDSDDSDEEIERLRNNKEIRQKAAHRVYGKDKRASKFLEFYFDNVPLFEHGTSC